MTVELSFDVPEWVIDNCILLVCIGLAVVWYTLAAIGIRKERFDHASALDRMILWAISPLICVVALPCYLVWAFGEYVLTRPEDRRPGQGPKTKE